MPRFNLLPLESVRQAKNYRQFVLLTRSSLLVIFWLFVISVIVFSTHVILTREIALIRETSDRLVMYNNYVAKSGLGQAVKRIEEEVTVLFEVQQNHFPWSSLFVRIFQNVPSGIRLQSVHGDALAGIVTIVGNASDRSALLDWQKFLQSVEGVEMVDLPITHLLNKDNVSFSLTLTLKKL